MPGRKPGVAATDGDALTAAAFLARLEALKSETERAKYARYFPQGHEEFIGVRMGQVFALAKEFVAMPPAEIDRLMESEVHEARAGAMSTMAKQYALKTTTAERRQELYELYLRRHDRINHWDLVDLAAYHVVGRHLVDGDRSVLDGLAASADRWERRTAIVATFAFIGRGQLDDTYRIAEGLIGDSDEFVQKAVGWALRTAGDRDPARLRAFLDRHAAAMARPALRAAIEHFAADERATYLSRRRS